MKQVKTVTTAPTVLCDYKLRRIQTLCGEKQMQCVIVVKLYYCLVFCFCSTWKVKNVHSLFVELLRHKSMLRDFNIVVFHSKKHGTEIGLS